jgi:F0F1-type ATP synthase gamma subunit
LPTRSSACSTQGEFDVCTLFYSEFKSVISQVPTAQQLIPASSSAADGEANASAIYDYEPSAEEILEDLLPQYSIKVQISGRCLRMLQVRWARKCPQWTTQPAMLAR